MNSSAWSGQWACNDCVSEIWRTSLNRFIDLAFRFIAKRCINTLIINESKSSERKCITPNSTDRLWGCVFTITGDELHDTSSHVVISHIMCSVPQGHFT